MSWALELYCCCLNDVATLLSFLTLQVRSDWVGILDLGSSQFLDEMSYEKEARNTIQIGADLAHMPGILVPTVIEEGSTDSVLVTSWVEGERLSERSSADVRELCDTLLSAYLHQLCSSGLLHADSHAGNLLVTPDGRVAILGAQSWGREEFPCTRSILRFVDSCSAGVVL